MNLFEEKKETFVDSVWYHDLGRSLRTYPHVIVILGLIGAAIHTHTHTTHLKCINARMYKTEILPSNPRLYSLYRLYHHVKSVACICVSLYALLSDT